MSLSIRALLFASCIVQSLTATAGSILDRDLTYLEPGSYLELKQDLQIEPNAHFMTFTWSGVTWNDASKETEILPYCHLMFTQVNHVRVLPAKTRLEIESISKDRAMDVGHLTTSGFYGATAYAIGYKINFKNSTGYMYCDVISWTPEEKTKIRAFGDLMNRIFSLKIKESPAEIINAGSM